MPPEAKTSSRYDGIKGDIFYLASILMILTTGVTAFDFPDKDDYLFNRIYYKQYKLYWDKIEPKFKQKKN